MFSVTAEKDDVIGTWTFKGDMNYHIESLKASGYIIVSVS